jgi:LDH2 family malate/lactate/ureidoglycolate dehydrogenase
MPVIQHKSLRQFVCKIFKAAGIPEDDARIVSDHLVNSNLAGHASHGVWCVPGYVDIMKENYVCWDDREVLREAACLAVVDCKGGNGRPRARRVRCSSVSQLSGRIDLKPGGIERRRPAPSSGGITAPAFRSTGTR